MFQKNSIMSLKKKSKSLGHLTGLGSPNFGSPKMKKQVSHRNFNMAEKLKFLNHSYHSNPPQQNGVIHYNNHIEAQQQQQQQPQSSYLHPALQRVPPVRSTTALNLGTPMADSKVMNGYTNGGGKGIKTTTPKKLKGLVRNKTTTSMPSPMAMGKAILAKAGNNNKGQNNNNMNHVVNSNNGYNSNNQTRNEAHLAEVFGSKDAGLIPNKHRAFLMDTQVKYTVGLQSQERNLFLFNDLLLIAKERSSSHFKLKDQIPLSDIWVSNCISEVSEVTLDSSTSFVIGWPITNAVITFSSSVQKNLWWDKLRDLIEKERSHSPQSTSVQVTYFDLGSNFEHLKSINVGVDDTAQECIRTALKSLDLSEEDVSKYQLWVRSKNDESPYPLIGHEIPLVIKLHWTRQAFNARSQKSYDEYKAGMRCSFILGEVGQMPNLDNVGSQKTKLKKVKSSIKLQNVFRRVSQGSNKTNDNEANDNSKNSKTGKLFGRPLDEVCGDNSIPKCVESMLTHVLKEGPSTVGIFRRSPNARAMRELREKLDCNETVDFVECSVFVTAALLKDFLRSLPDCLLMCQHYQEWITLAQKYSEERQVDPVKSFASTLPRMNGVLLQHLLFLLNKIASSSQENMMTSSNLAICVGPSVLWSKDTSVEMDQNYSKNVSNVMQILIEQYFQIFGDAVPFMFCDQKTELNPLETEETNMELEEKTIFVKGPNASKSSNGILQKTQAKRMFDNSSLDSLLDATYNSTNQFSMERISASTSASPHQNHPQSNTNSSGHSLTNLSQDSGLTTSDSQLYAFEDHSSADEMGTPRTPIKKPLIKHLSTSAFLPGKDFTLPGQVPSFNVNNEEREQTYRNFIYRTSTDHDFNNLGYPSNEQLLRRTTSEESIIHHAHNNHVNHSNLIHISRSRRRPAAHRKGRAPAPPNGSSIQRSNSVNQVRNGEIKLKHPAEWYRSRSTTRLNQDNVNKNNSSSCSTLSDEDCTPHVSRSNSYGKAEEDPFAVQGAYDIYLRDDHLATRIGVGRISTTTPTFNVDTPPGYEETISRQRLLKHYHRSNSFVISPSSPSPSNTTQVKTRLIFEDSSSPFVTTTPPPLPPKTERPPLPPKQKIRLSVEDTYVNSAELRMDTDDHLVYPAYKAGGARIHVSHASSGSSGTVVESVIVKNPPQLPPKENQSRPKKRSVTKIVTASTAATQTKSMKNAETQTDETDFYLMYQDEHGNWVEEGEEMDDDDEEHEEEDEEDYSESNRSLSPEYYPSMTNGNLIYDNPEYLELARVNGGSAHNPAGFFERPVSTQNVELRQAGRRKLEPVQSIPVSSKVGGGGGVNTKVDPIIQGEINWSVSQLRTLFNQGQLSPNGPDNSSNSTNSSGHNSSASSSYNRFTNGEYIDSASKANKASRQVLRSGGGVFVEPLMSQSDQLTHHGYNVTANTQEPDSDQESYV